MTDASNRIWSSVDRLLEGAEIEGILVHKLGALAARRFRRLGEPVPPALGASERAATFAMRVAKLLLERVRACCDGPLVLIKGPEVARIYPGGARTFSDVDLLVPNAALVHRTLRSRGFIEVEDPELFVDHHHLRPLRWPTLGLTVEIHSGLPWPDRLEPPPLSEVFEGARPSKTGIEGISAPDAIHHALILAAHAWVHEPLGILRELVDVAAVAGDAVQSEVDRTARAWGIHRVWRTTRNTADALLEGGPPALPVRLWARHLPLVRERTVLDNHLARWLHSFWELPPPAALFATGGLLREYLLTTPDESWRDKLIRVRHAVRHPHAPLSSHTLDWEKEAMREQADRRRLGQR